MSKTTLLPGVSIARETQLEQENDDLKLQVQNLQELLEEAKSNSEQWAERWRRTALQQRLITQACESMKDMCHQLETRIDCASQLSIPSTVFRDEDVQWVVNDMSEIGVKIGDQVFFCYKGESIQYGMYRDSRSSDVNYCVSEGQEESFVIEGELCCYRPVEKCELGEVLRTPEKVEADDSNDWKPLPAAPQELWKD